jgi:hypothetical protein
VIFLYNKKGQSIQVEWFHCFDVYILDYPFLMRQFSIGYPPFRFHVIKRDKEHPHILSAMHRLPRQLVSAKLAKAKTEA